MSLPHMIVIFVVVLVVFGPQKLPELARGLGKLMAEFRKASSDFRSAFEQEMHDLDRQARETQWKKSQAPQNPAEPASSQPADQTAANASAPEPETVARQADAEAGAAVPSGQEAKPEKSAAAVPADDGDSSHGII